MTSGETCQATKCSRERTQVNTDKEHEASDRAWLPTGPLPTTPAWVLLPSSPPPPRAPDLPSDQRVPLRVVLCEGSSCSGWLAGEARASALLAPGLLQLCSSNSTQPLPLPPSAVLGAGNGAENKTAWPWPHGVDLEGCRSYSGHGRPLGRAGVQARGWRGEKEGIGQEGLSPPRSGEGAFQGRRGSNTKTQGGDLLGGFKGQRNRLGGRQSPRWVGLADSHEDLASTE